MKIPRKKLELRPTRPGFLNIIPRLPTMVLKKRILYNIFTPITYVFRTFKNIFKKKPMTTFYRNLKLEKRMQQLSNHDVNDNMDLNESRENIGGVENDENIITEGVSYMKRKIANTLSRVKFPLKILCPSCEEDVPAIDICSICLSQGPKLPYESCQACKKEASVMIYFCLKYHGERPKICFKNKSITQNLMEKIKIRKFRRSTFIHCSGKSSAINNCPMCHCIWPTLGECECKDCKRTQPIIQYRPPRKQNHNVEIYLCPCPACKHLLPNMKICDICRDSYNQKTFKNDSIYVLVQ